MSKGEYIPDTLSVYKKDTFAKLKILAYGGMTSALMPYTPKAGIPVICQLQVLLKMSSKRIVPFLCLLFSKSPVNPSLWQTLT